MTRAANRCGDTDVVEWRLGGSGRRLEICNECTDAMDVAADIVSRGVFQLHFDQFVAEPAIIGENVILAEGFDQGLPAQRSGGEGVGNQLAVGIARIVI